METNRRNRLVPIGILIILAGFYCIGETLAAAGSTINDKTPTTQITAPDVCEGIDHTIQELNDAAMQGDQNVQWVAAFLAYRCGWTGRFTLPSAYMGGDKEICYDEYVSGNQALICIPR